MKGVILNCIQEMLTNINVFRKKVGCSEKEFSMNFGDFGVNLFSQKLYSHIYRNSKNEKEFLMKIKNVH